MASRLSPDEWRRIHRFTSKPRHERSLEDLVPDADEPPGEHSA